jgi:hypothetical protein
MKRFFTESPHIVSGLCDSLKTASRYKDRIIEGIKAQLGNNPFHRNRVVPSDEHTDATVMADEEDPDFILKKKPEQQDRSSQSI